MKVGDIIELNGKSVQIDAVLSGGNYSFHEVKAVPKKEVTEEVKEEVKEEETPKKKTRKKA